MVITAWFCVLLVLQLVATEPIRYVVNNQHATRGSKRLICQNHRLQTGVTEDNARRNAWAQAHPSIAEGIVNDIAVTKTAAHRGVRHGPGPTKILIPRTSTTSPSSPPTNALDPTKIWSDPKNIFSPSGPIFINFDPNMLNAVKTAFLEAIRLADFGLAHASQQTANYRRYFRDSDRELVMKVFEYIRGDGNGPKGMRERPLRVVFHDHRFIGGQLSDNPCTRASVGSVDLAV